MAGAEVDPASYKGPRKYHKVVLGRTEFVVDSRYRDLRPIGRGAYGLVAAAVDVVTKRRVAIKRISRVFEDLVDAKRNLREIKLLRHLGGHENIVEVIDVMTSPPETKDFETVYLVTQLFECDLDRIIASPQPLTDQHVQYFVYQILRGLKFVHSAGILHRDIKSSNILVNANCDLAICDFGLARGTSGADVKLTEYVVTRWYRAPELLCGASRYSTPVDVWSTGCIMAEILIRKVLFKGHNPLEQIHLIVSFLGSPTEEELEGFEGPGARDVFARLPVYPKRPMSELITGANPHALDVLGRMLEIDPRKRITVDEALAHPYFAELHKRATEPSCDSHFDFSFETKYRDGDIPRKDLQTLFYDEMLAVREDSERRRLAAIAAGTEAGAGLGAFGAGSVPEPGAAEGGGMDVTGASPADAPTRDPAAMDTS